MPFDLARREIAAAPFFELFERLDATKLIYPIGGKPITEQQNILERIFGRRGIVVEKKRVKNYYIPMPCRSERHAAVIYDIVQEEATLIIPVAALAPSGMRIGTSAEIVPEAEAEGMRFSLASLKHVPAKGADGVNTEDNEEDVAAHFFEPEWFAPLFGSWEA